MKKVLALLAIAALLIGCGAQVAEAAEGDVVPIGETIVIPDLTHVRIVDDGASIINKTWELDAYYGYLDGDGNFVQSSGYKVKENMLYTDAEYDSLREASKGTDTELMTYIANNLKLT